MHFLLFSGLFFVYVCVCVHMCMYVFLSSCTRLCVCVYASVCAYVHMCRMSQFVIYVYISKTWLKMLIMPDCQQEFSLFFVFSKDAAERINYAHLKLKLQRIHTSLPDYFHCQTNLYCFHNSPPKSCDCPEILETSFDSKVYKHQSAFFYLARTFWSNAFLFGK